MSGPLSRGSSCFMSMRNSTLTIASPSASGKGARSPAASGSIDSSSEPRYDINGGSLPKASRSLAPLAKRMPELLNPSLYASGRQPKGGIPVGCRHERRQVGRLEVQYVRNESLSAAATTKRTGDARTCNEPFYRSVGSSIEVGYRLKPFRQKRGRQCAWNIHKGAPRRSSSPGARFPP